MRVSFNERYFAEYDRDSHYVHEPVPMTYQTFIINNEKYFQLDCYSKAIIIDDIGPSIQSKHKLQFGEEEAKEFISLLKKEFGFQ